MRTAAPEVIANSRTYDGKLADVWSSGVMLYVMLFCEYPFERPEDAGDPHRFQKVPPLQQCTPAEGFLCLLRRCKHRAACSSLSAIAARCACSHCAHGAPAEQQM